ncbi:MULTISPECIES: hypothetical protein [unclassified Dokdonia]|nr:MULTISPECIES: hypothetical protein [unclassified Dokdonia]
METEEEQSNSKVFKAVLKTIAITMVSILVLAIIAFFITITFFE